MIKISIGSDCIFIYTSLFHIKTKMDILDTCGNEKCIAEVYDDETIKVSGTKTQLFELLYKLTYDYVLFIN